MKPVVIGLVLAILSMLVAIAVGAFFVVPRISGVMGPEGSTSSPAPSSFTLPPSSFSPPPGTSTPTPATPGPGSGGSGQTAAVNFEIAVIGVSGSGLTQTVSAQVSNTGTADAHNVWVKVELFCQGQRVKLNGQDSMRVDIGTIKAKSSANAQATLSVGLFDGLKIQANGAQFVLTVNSAERTQTLAYDYKP